jgi:hypothetical protein
MNYLPQLRVSRHLMKRLGKICYSFCRNRDLGHIPMKWTAMSAIQRVCDMGRRRLVRRGILTLIVQHHNMPACRGILTLIIQHHNMPACRDILTLIIQDHNMPECRDILTLIIQHHNMPACRGILTLII